MQTDGAPCAIVTIFQSKSSIMKTSLRTLALVSTALALLSLPGLGGCSDDPVSVPDPPDEVLPNYVTLTLTNTADPAEVITASFRDADGDGGASGTVDTLRLKAGTTYTALFAAEFRGRYPGTIRDTVIDLNEDYVESATEHQVWYTLSGPSAGSIAVTVIDKDSKNQPLGIASRIVVASGGMGTAALRVELGHYDDPARPKDGVRPPYERDVDVTFPVILN